MMGRMRLKRLLRKAYNVFPWARRRGLRMELLYWDNWFDDPRNASELAYRLDPDAPVDEVWDRLLSALPTQARVLDVGAGPLTAIGKIFRGERIDLVASDVLAPEYNRLLANRDLKPPVRTLYAPSEELVRHLSPRTFHLVYCRNALDHASDPLQSLQEMYRLLEPGGMIYLSHYPNEADHQQNAGLHQWNFNCRDGQFTISGKGTRYVVNDLFEHVTALRTEELVIATIRKAAVSVDSPSSRISLA